MSSRSGMGRKPEGDVVDDLGRIERLLLTVVALLRLLLSGVFHRHIVVAMPEMLRRSRLVHDGDIPCILHVKEVKPRLEAVVA